MSQYWRDNLAIWSHWPHVSLIVNFEEIKQLRSIDILSNSQYLKMMEPSETLIKNVHNILKSILLII